MRQPKSARLGLGVNGGVNFVRNSPRAHRVWSDWWDRPLRLSKAERRSYTDWWPGHQNGLNDAIVANPAHSSCVHILPSDVLFEPGQYVRHFTGVGANKEQLFLQHHGAAAIHALLRLPSWNATACPTVQRKVRMAATERAASSSASMHETTRRDWVEIELTVTEHCRLAEAAGLAQELRALWRVGL